MAFHEHSPGDNLLVLWEGELYRNDGLSKGQHFVNAHVDVRQFQQTLQLLIDLQSDEADTDVSFDTPSCEVEHRPDLYFGLGYAERLLHMPQVMVCGIYL